MAIISDFGVEGVLFTMLDMETNSRLLGHLQVSGSCEREPDNYKVKSDEMNVIFNPFDNP